jgi:hypothetical protein
MIAQARECNQKILDRLLITSELLRGSRKWAIFTIVVTLLSTRIHVSNRTRRPSPDAKLSDTNTFQGYQHAVTVNRQCASGLRSADRHAHALWHALILFRFLTQGFHSIDLRHHVATTTYQLRRLRLHNLIERVPKSISAVQLATQLVNGARLSVSPTSCVGESAEERT